MSRLIDADVLMEILTTAIRNMKGVAKFIGAEDDHEIKMVIKAYTDIANGVKDMPTIELRCEECEAFNKTRLLIPQPERKKGKWVDGHTTCSECGWQMLDDVMETPNIVGFKFCPNCGAKMEEGDRS